MRMTLMKIIRKIEVLCRGKEKFGIYPIQAIHPFQIVGINRVGPLTGTEDGYRHVIVAQDYFTKWPMVQ